MENNCAPCSFYFLLSAFNPRRRKRMRTCMCLYTTVTDFQFLATRRPEECDNVCSENASFSNGFTISVTCRPINYKPLGFRDVGTISVQQYLGKGRRTKACYG